MSSSETKKGWAMVILLQSYNCVLSRFTIKFHCSFCYFHVDLQTWVIIRGLSQNTTKDALQNYFENTRRSGGDNVEEVNIKGDWARIKFESAEGTVYACETFVSFPFSMRGD